MLDQIGTLSRALKTMHDPHTRKSAPTCQSFERELKLCLSLEKLLSIDGWNFVPGRKFARLVPPVTQAHLACQDTLIYRSDEGLL